MHRKHLLACAHLMQPGQLCAKRSVRVSICEPASLHTDIYHAYQYCCMSTMTKHATDRQCGARGTAAVAISVCRHHRSGLVRT